MRSAAAISALALAACGAAHHPAMRSAEQPHAAVLLRVDDRFHPPDAILDERVLVDGARFEPARARGGMLLRLAPGVHDVQLHTAYYDEQPVRSVEIVSERRPVTCIDPNGGYGTCHAWVQVPRSVVRSVRIDRGGCIATTRIRVSDGDRRVLEAWIEGPNRCGIR